MSIVSTNYGIYLGEFNNSESFRAGVKKFNSDRIKLYAGEKTFLIHTGFIAKKDLSRSMKLFVGIDYDLKLSASEVLFIDESSGFPLLRKKTSVPLYIPEISYTSGQEGSWADAFFLSSFKLKVGVILGR